MTRSLPSSRIATGREWRSRPHRKPAPSEPTRVRDRERAASESDRYRGLFENSPISLWEEDFSELKAYLDRLRASGIGDLAAYFRDNPDEVQRCASLVVVVDVNEATLRLLECESKDRLLGRLPIIFRKASYDVFMEEVLALAAGETVFETDVVNRTFQGSEIEVRVRLTLAPGHEESWSKVFVSLTDITDWKRTQAQLELHRVAMESSADAIFITGRDGAIEWANTAFVEMSGFSREEVVGQTPRILKSGRHDEAYYEDLWATLLAGRPCRTRTVNRKKDGSLFTVEQTITPIADGRGELTHFVAVQQDISERLESEERLVRLARTDPLTGLPNRYTFNDRLEREALRAARKGHSVAVLMLDVDHFKDVNDLFGHPVGDAFLVQVAERLTDSLRSLDTVARLGGDEFAVLQTDAGRPDATATLAQRLISIIETPFEVDGYAISTSVSIGIALARPGEIDPKQMIRQADMALYRAKQRGRGTFRFHRREMDRQVQERLTLSRDLRQAIERDELYLELQPLVELPSRRIVAVEALTRWRHPQMGPVPPSKFIPLAENNGFIVPLGEWVLRTACCSIRELRRRTGTDLALAVNVSAVQMRAPGFADTVLSVLEETGLPHDALEIELTESVFVHHTRQVERTMEDLHRVGVNFSIDDFGTGYSSMIYLRQLKVDELKIDRSFLERVEESESDAAIVAAIIALGKKLGLRVLAEGVERESQVDFLMENGCDRMQGYLVSRPVAVERIAEMVGGLA